MKITKFKRYISWNIMSLIGYICIVITFIFLGILLIASSGTTIRPDINEIYYNYIIKHIINPYISFYKFQLSLIAFCLIFSIFEHKYYKQTKQFGLRIFENHEKYYSIAFVTGLAVNFLPLNLILMIIISWIMRFIL